jgi:hypothetical protein
MREEKLAAVIQRGDVDAVDAEFSALFGESLRTPASNVPRIGEQFDRKRANLLYLFAPLEQN